MKYHISEDGNPRICKASKNPCRYGAADHFSSKETARQAYEARQESNALTLDSYNATVEQYIAGSPNQLSPTLQAWLDDSVGGLPEGARVVEIGAAFGRDSRYLAEKGFDVVPTDAAEGFVELLKKEFPNTRKIDVVNDKIPYADAVIANAVFLHLNKEEAQKAFANVASSLPPGGRFGMTLKKGDGEEWSNEKIDAPRYFKYWQPQDLEAELNAAGFSEVSISEDSVGSTTWLQVTATKPLPTEESYKMQHQPDEDGATGYAIDTHFPDFYEHPEWYRTGADKSDAESIRAIKKMRGNPEAEVTIYRAVPKVEYGIKPGNWVSLSKDYATGHGLTSEDSDEEDWPVVEMKVKAKDIRSPGDSINEWGYFPSPEN